MDTNLLAAYFVVFNNPVTGEADWVTASTRKQAKRMADAGIRVAGTAQIVHDVTIYTKRQFVKAGHLN